MNIHNDVPNNPFSLFSGEGQGADSIEILSPNRAFGQAKLHYSVNITTGNLTAHDRKITVHDTGNEMIFSYCYHSGTNAWKLTHGRKIKSQSIQSYLSSYLYSNTITVTEADGVDVTYTQHSDGNYYGPVQHGARPYIQFDDTKKTCRWYHPKTRITEQFDAAGLLKTKTDENGNETTYEYDENKELTAIIAPSGTRFEIRKTNGTVKIFSVNTNKEETLLHTYQFENGQLKTSETADGYLVTYAYHENGKLKNITQNDKSKIAFDFDNNTDKIKQIEVGDNQQNISQLTYENDTTTIKDACNITTAYEIDKKSHTITIKKQDDDTVRYYTSSGQIEKIIYPDKSTEEFAYETTSGLLKKHVYRDGSYTQFSRDDLKNPDLITA